MMKDKKGKGYAKGGMVTKNGPNRGKKMDGEMSMDGGYTGLADKTKASPARPL